MPAEGLALAAALTRSLVAIIAALLLRGPADAGADSAEPAIFGPLQLLVVLGVIVLLMLLAGLVFLRIRRTRPK
jgi:hypothetical protein